MTAPTWWLARGEHELPGDSSWLTPAEAERAAGMRFTKRRTEYLLRRWVGKQAVAGALGVPVVDFSELARIEIANHGSGAPYVVVDGRRSELDVSLTDRAGWGVCLVGPDLRVGCDLELVEARSRGFVADFLTQDERAWVASQEDGEARDAAANLLWSAKESALKVLQTGLRRDTRSVEVTVGGAAADGWGRLTMRTAEGGRLPGWWRREGVFVLTVAAASPFLPPRPLPGGARLSDASPVHSWVANPLAF